MQIVLSERILRPEYPDSPHGWVEAMFISGFLCAKQVPGHAIQGLQDAEKFTKLKPRSQKRNRGTQIFSRSIETGQAAYFCAGRPIALAAVPSVSIWAASLKVSEAGDRL